MSKQQEKTYFSFTDPKITNGFVIVGGKLLDDQETIVGGNVESIFEIPSERATIALKKEGDKYKYGIAICSVDDNFNKHFGKMLAEKRLQRGFGEIPVAKLAEFTKDKNSEETKALRVLSQLKNTVQQKLPKYKRKLEEWQKNQNM